MLSLWVPGLQAKLQYFKDLADKQQGLLAAEVNGSTRLQEQYKQQEKHFQRRAEDARRTIEVARSAMTQQGMTGHAHAIHVLEQGLCSNPNCKVADSKHGGKEFPMFGRSDCKCPGMWRPEAGLWEDQVWTDQKGKPTGYYSYTYKESEIDSALDIYWVRVLAERIKAKIQKERPGATNKPLIVLELPETWPERVPEQLMSAYRRRIVPCCRLLAACCLVAALRSWRYVR